MTSDKNVSYVWGSKQIIYLDLVQKIHLSTKGLQEYSGVRCDAPKVQNCQNTNTLVRLRSGEECLLT